MARKPAQRPLQEELAPITGGRDITRGYVPENLPLYPQDGVLTAKGNDYRLYEWVASDDQVKTVLEQRRMAVVSREWVVEPGGTARIDRKAADFMREQLQHIGWDGVTDRMLWGVFYGYAVGECIYANDGQQIGLDAVRVRKQRRFRFAPDRRLLLLTSARPFGEPMPDRKFWTFATGADNDDEPYGLGLAHWLYWPVYFKRNGLKFWMIFLDKLGVPTTVGRYDPTASEAEKRKLLDALLAIQTDAAIVLPKGMEAELLEAARSTTPDYATLLDKMDAAIAKVVVGQTMTVDNGSSRAQADVHKDVRQDIVKADSDLACESWNRGPGTWLTEWNFAGAQPPRVYRRLEDEPDQKALAERDKSIFAMGFKPTLKYITDTYGPDWVERQTVPATPALPGQPQPGGAGAEPPADLAEPQRAAKDSVDHLVDRLAAATAADVDAMIATIRDLVETSASLDEVAQRLVELYPKLEGGALADAMAQALLTAELAGRAGIAV